MKNIFVTLFDSGYLTRGITMYESLRRVCKEFKLYIIAFDSEVYNKLYELHLEGVILISLSEFEDEELLNVKSKRSRGEYCWTSTPKSVLYVFNKFQEKICTYIDADMLFFKDPQVLVDELGDSDVVITEHRYAEYCDQTYESGKYCVQFMPFKNNQNGRKILNWWKDRCLENCGHDIEKGICGDQKYLDNWCEQFSGVHELENIGGGVAPWNVSKYSFYNDNGIIKMKELDTLKREDLVFYHFHNLVFFDKGVVQLTGKRYFIPDTALVYIYKYYFKLHYSICNKYGLDNEKWSNTQHFRDNNMDDIKHESNYHLLDLFL